MLENFSKYLTDARYYIKFYQQYSHYWAPQATRTIIPYKGMYIPLEKRKEEETYHFGEPVSHFKPLRKLIYQDFHNRVREGQPPSFDLNGNLPTFAMYYARTTFVPPMSDEEMEALFYPDRLLDRNRAPYREQKHKALSLGRKRKSNVDISFYNELNVFQTIYLTRYHLLRHMHQAMCSYFNLSNERYISQTGEEFLDSLNRFVNHITNNYTE
jgi:hypothetical protein